MNPIIPFYNNEAPDAHGRYLKDIQQWPDKRLEAVHNFIQWMFPLSDRSGANPDAPVLDAETIAAFRSRPELQENLRLSFHRMLAFYGLDITLKRAENYQERSDVWLSPGNHNHLRITRIIKSLRLLGLEKEAREFFGCLSEIYRDQPENVRKISQATFRYWESAAFDPL